MSTADKTITCRDCGQPFVFSASEQAFFTERGFGDPVRCLSCRRALKAKKAGAEPGAAPARPPQDARRPTYSSGPSVADQPRRGSDGDRHQDVPIESAPPYSRSRHRERADEGSGTESWGGADGGDRDRPGRDRRREAAKGQRRRRTEDDDFDY